MFRRVPLSIIRRFSLYTQQWYMSYSFADSLLADSEFSNLILLASCQKTCMTYSTVVCTVLNSWLWTEELSETCRVLFQKYIWEISASSYFYYKNISRSTVIWTSKSGGIALSIRNVGLTWTRHMTSFPCRYILWRNAAGINWTDLFLGIKFGLDLVQKRNISSIPGIQSRISGSLACRLLTISTEETSANVNYNCTKIMSFMKVPYKFRNQLNIFQYLW